MALQKCKIIIIVIILNVDTIEDFWVKSESLS